MSIEENLERMIKLKSGSIRAFAIESDIKYTTLRSMLERGIMNSNVENAFKLAKTLGIKPERLADLETDEFMLDEIINKTIKLEPARQRNVYNYADQQLQEQTQTTTVYGLTAAGEPIEYTDDLIEEKEVAYIPAGADVALSISGDSMEPDYKDGSIVFYKRQPTIENGELAVVEIDHSVTFKKVKLDYDNNKIILQSLNDKYDDKEFDSEEVTILGKVLN